MFRVFIFVLSLFLSLSFQKLSPEKRERERERERERARPILLSPLPTHRSSFRLFFAVAVYVFVVKSALFCVGVVSFSRRRRRRRRRLVVREKIRTLSKDAPTRETKLLSPPRDASETRPRRSGVLFFVVVFSI